METKRILDVEPGEIFLFKKQGEELAAWIHIGFTTGYPKPLICKKNDRDCRIARGEALYDYVGRSKYVELPISKHVLA